MGGRHHFYFAVRKFHRSQPYLMLTVVARGSFVTPPLDIDSGDTKGGPTPT